MASVLLEERVGVGEVGLTPGLPANKFTPPAGDGDMVVLELVEVLDLEESELLVKLPSLTNLSFPHLLSVIEVLHLSLKLWLYFIFEG